MSHRPRWLIIGYPKNGDKENDIVNVGGEEKHAKCIQWIVDVLLFMRRCVLHVR